MNSAHNYSAYDRQSLKIRFELRKTRNKATHRSGTADAKIPYDGSIQFFVRIDSIEYGPYAAGIFTFRSYWEGRKAKRVSQESQQLIQQLVAFQNKLEALYAELVRLERPVDGQLIFDCLKNPHHLRKGTTLLDVYQEFMSARKNLVVSNRSKRQESQIAPTTFETYPKRWALLYSYLLHIKRNQLPVKAIRYEFATNLKEWLYGQRKPNGDPYQVATVNKVISMLKMLLGYALSKGYIDHNPVLSFPCRGSSPANPKPLTKAQLDHLEACELPPFLRWMCDSWLIAGELCLHYSDFIQLPQMKFINSNGITIIQHARSKQTGNRLIQTVNVTERAQRLIDKWGGVSRLNYRSSAHYSKALKDIARLADLRDSEGNLVGIQFGQGRDSGLTQRAIDGANGIQLSKIAGWSKPVYAERYIGNPVAIVEEFAKTVKAGKCLPPNPVQPFVRVQKVG